MNQINIKDYHHFFFIGIAGAGMSAIAQYLAGIGKQVSGSDRYFTQDTNNELRRKLEDTGIKTFPQDGSGLKGEIQMVIVSTAVEKSNIEYAKALENNLRIVHRADILAAISETKKTIAVSGTSGKSTTVAMLYQIMEYAGYAPSLITGAGLISLIKKGEIGNAVAGKGDYLIIEADESDGSLIKYRPDTGVLLNIDKDHKEISVLKDIFKKFKENTRNLFVVNYSHPIASQFSVNNKFDFGYTACRYCTGGFKQSGYEIRFKINEVNFKIPIIGKHNMENAAAAVAVAHQKGISLEKCAQALSAYKGIYRRMQIIDSKNGITIIDDYAHNPVKIAAAISACQNIADKVIAWFQPHGFGPTRFLKDEFINQISATLGPDDEIWMSEIYYAGGTVTKDISANDLIKGIKEKGKNAFFVENKLDFPAEIKKGLTNNTLILLMGARDPSLEKFAEYVSEKLLP
ncbi:MAG: Mur ligase domain-containing protein [Bacteroidales bacterium]|nr:Mur ligase domain-containing protein [Bacteroidales bacterium]